MKLLILALLLCVNSLVVYSQVFNYTLSGDAALYQADLAELEAHMERRILGGTAISHAEWRLTRPWQVQNVCDYSDGNGWVPCGCSSTIVDSHYLLTAGHCLECPYAYRVGLRFSDGHVDDQPWQEIHTPNWQYGSLESKEYCGIRSVINQDISLQYLAKPIRFRYGVQPFPNLLAKRIDFNLLGAYVAGWGASTEQGANPADPVFSNQLNKIRERVYPNIKCQTKILEWLAILGQVAPGACPLSGFDFNDGLLCASAKDIDTISFSLSPDTFGVPNDPKGICLGDSGSPLFDPLTYGVLGFVSDTLSTNAYYPCGYGVDVFTKFTDELKEWVRSELKVERPKHWVCPNAAH